MPEILVPPGGAELAARRSRGSETWVSGRVEQ